MRMIAIVLGALIVTAAGDPPWGYTGPGWYQVEEGEFIYGGPYPIEATCERGSGSITCIYLDAWPTPEPSNVPALNVEAATGTDAMDDVGAWNGPGWYQLEDDMLNGTLTAGPFSTERSCKETLKQSAADYYYACIKLDGPRPSAGAANDVTRVSKN